jgi:hypothetical protein
LVLFVWFRQASPPGPTPGTLFFLGKFNQLFAQTLPSHSILLGVGLMAILSIRDGWFNYLIILLHLMVCGICIASLWQEYRPDFNSKQCKRGDQKRPSKINDAPGGKLGKLGSCHKYLQLHLGNLRHRIRVGWTNLRNGFLKLIYPCLKFLGFAHKEERGQSLVLTHVQVRFGYLMRFSSSNSHAGTATLTDWLHTPTRASLT